VLDEPILVNLDDRSSKLRLMQTIGSMSGLWEFTWKRVTEKRSLRANRYYFVAIVTPFREWLRQEWGASSITSDQAHELLKTKILGKKEIINKTTGEVLDVAPTTHEMNQEQFSNYVERAILFLGEFAGIEVVPAEMFYGKGEGNT